MTTALTLLVAIKRVEWAPKLSNYSKSGSGRAVAGEKEELWKAFCGKEGEEKGGVW